MVVSQLVKAPPEKVYSAYTDFEATPKWSKRIRGVRVTKKEGDLVHLENDMVSPKGKDRRSAGELRLTPPSKVESHSETRFTKTKRIVTFEETPEGTKVTATLDIEMKGGWGLVLSPKANKEKAEASALEELVSFARYAESLP